MADEPVNVKEYEELARLALSKKNFDFFRGGAEDEHTLNDNTKAFQKILFRPRVLIDVSSIDLSTTIFGYKTDAPILVAPTGTQKLAHPAGEVATARAAAASNTIMVLSYASSYTIEEVASSSNGAIRFFQLCVFKRRDIVATLVQRAEKCGFKAIVVTVDAPKLGRREADIKNRLGAPMFRNLQGLLSVDVNSMSTVGSSKLGAFISTAMDPSLNWKDIEWLKSITKLPILIKGVLTAEDAKKAVEAGVSGVIVSNHGGRQLDYSPATITVLEEIVQAVCGKIPVLIDGGIRRGTDIFKAIALGAKAVMVGRPVAYGLAAKGESGVRNVLKMLKDELELTMALTGCPTLKDITRAHISTERDRLRSLL